MPHIQLANPRGFCAGVDRAIGIVERAIELYGGPIYVRHEVVHNRSVVDDLRGRGAVFVEEVEEIPEGATAIFSAHGVAQSVRDEAGARNLNVFDATCPLVTKVHMEVRAHARKGREVILIGHAGHPEVEGTMGQYFPYAVGDGTMHLVQDEDEARSVQARNPDDLAFVTQTTLSLDDTARIVEILQERFPRIQGPRKDDICYATQNRQDAVRGLAEACDVVLVVGSVNSSNSNRLKELAERTGARAWLIDGAEDLDESWVQGVDRIGVTAGASAPERLVVDVVQRLQTLGCTGPEERVGQEEHVVFAMPRALAS